MGNDMNITIDDNQLTFEPGDTILDVAQRNGIYIPTLCQLKGTTPTGACRICVVEMKRAGKLVESCATPASSGMEIFTESAKVVNARKEIIRLMLASGNHNCTARNFEIEDWTDFQMKVMAEEGAERLCPVWGDCKLQDLAYRYQVDTKDMPPSFGKYPMEKVNPFIIRDFSRCILCGRCVKACKEVQVNNAIDFGYRGAQTKIIAGTDVPLKDSNCVFCGECVDVCPVGALVLKPALSVDRSGNVEKVRSTCAFCGVGCQIKIHTEDNRIVRIEGAGRDIPPNYGSLCVKGRFGFDFVGSDERLTTPLIKENGTFRNASWKEAFDLVAEKLSGIKDQFGPQALGVLTSARITNEENYIAQKFARAVLKTNNVDHCARLCHSSTVAGLAASFGSGAMTNTIADIEKADTIIVMGSNTTENHPVLSSFVKRASLNGKTLIVIDPRRIVLTHHADKWLRLQPGSDIALINALMHVIIKEELYDRDFVENRTENFEALAETVEKYSPEHVSKISDVDTDDIIEAARLYAKAARGSILYCMGITQHITGTDNVKSLANLAMLCGNLGIEGGGVNPLRGQNNVQGACDMGGLPNVFTAYRKVDDDSARQSYEKAWQVTDLPSKPGHPVTEMVDMAEKGTLKSLYVIGENPLVSDPDLNHAEKAFGNLDFLVVQDIFLTETAKTADVVLPAFCFAEKEGTFTNTERRVQRVRKAVEAPGYAKEDWKIICEVAGRMGYPMNYTESREIFEEITAVAPSYAGITWDRIEEEGIHWPCPTGDHPGTPILHTEQFTRGKGAFFAIEHASPAEMTDGEYPFILTTGRVLYHYHTGSMTMKTQGLNELSSECFVEISPEDAEQLGLKNGGMARVSSRRGSITARVRVSPMAVDRTIFIPFHFGQTAANRLTNAKLDPVAKIPEIKICAIKVEKAVA